MYTNDENADTNACILFNLDHRIIMLYSMPYRLCSIRVADVVLVNQGILLKRITLRYKSQSRSCSLYRSGQL